jgi:predicted nuclease of predicted toxin-antitoxin system
MIHFVADEGVDAPIVHSLRDAGFNVLYIAEEAPRTEDDKVLLMANDQQRVLITLDKDFGELVYRMQQSHAGVILVRLGGFKPKRKAEIVLEAVKKHEEKLMNAFTVIHKGIIKIRSR